MKWLVKGELLRVLETNVCRTHCSLITRFLTVGTLLRRLEIFVAILRTKYV